MLTNGKEDNSTQLVDGDTLFNLNGAGGPLQDNPDSATMAMPSPFGGQPAAGDAAAPTDPMRQKVTRMDHPVTDAAAAGSNGPQPDSTMSPQNLAAMAKVTMVEPPRGNPAIRGRRPSGPTPALLERDTDAPDTLPPPTPPAPGPARPVPIRKRRAPTATPGALAASRPEPRAESSSGVGKLLVVMIFAAVVLLGGGLGALFFFKAAPQGLVYISVPEHAEVLEVSINGEPVTQKDGSPVTFPHLHAVKAGQATVLVKLKGYKPLLETVTVKEGAEYVQLSKPFEK
jgi:hypothetical protein